MTTEEHMTANGKHDFDPREVSLSETPDELLPAFGRIERAVILYCKVLTGKITTEELVKKYGRGNARNTSNAKKVGRI